MNQPARVLETADVRHLLRHVRNYRYPLISETMIRLSYKAGLRACEMAGLDWTMVLKPGGSLGTIWSSRDRSRRTAPPVACR